MKAGRRRLSRTMRGLANACTRSDATSYEHRCDAPSDQNKADAAANP